MEKISEDKFEEIMYGLHFIAVNALSYTYKGRWTTNVEQVLQNQTDLTFWKICWQVGNTENQECDLGATMQQVYPHTVKTVIYKSEK